MNSSRGQQVERKNSVEIIGVIPSILASIDQMNLSTGIWTAVEDSELKAAVATHGGKGWVAIALLVPGRTPKQSSQRWREALDPIINQTIGRTGK
jgi:hypothetical protein